jgi:ABC-type Fe3+ transport system substrate-binding protein
LPEPAIVVAASGGTVDRGLAPLEEVFLAESGWFADVRRLGSELDVWNLAAKENSLGVDVIEVGFRTDAMSGEAGEVFLPIDPRIVPSLDRIPDRFRIPEDRGVVVGFSGLLGLAVSEQVSSPPRSWNDLAPFAARGALGIPSPGSLTASLFVLALGEQDPSVGLERYAALIDAGAVTLGPSDEFIAAFNEGLEVGVWTTSGMWRSEGRLPGVRFIVPDEGAVGLPAFAGVLASAQNPELAMEWIEFRLSEPVQQAMSSIAEQGRFGSEDVPAISPVVPGIEGLGDGGLAYFTLDDLDGDVIGLDWSRFSETRAAIDSFFEDAGS